MPRARLDDGFPDHPKIVGLNDRAFRLHVTAICWSARFLTDGDITAAVRSLLAVAEATTDHVDELVAAGVWEREDGRVSIHDFLDYNPSREQVEAFRSAATERQRRRRSKVSMSRRDNAVSHSSPARPGPARPQPDPDPVPAEQAGLQASNGHLVEFFCDRFGVEATPKLRERLAVLESSYPEWSVPEALEEARSRQARNPLKYVERMFADAKAEGRQPSYVTPLHQAPEGSARGQFLNRFRAAAGPAERAEQRLAAHAARGAG